MSSLDTTFGADGKVITAIGTGADEAWGVALQPNGRIVVAGQSFNGSNNDFVLVRYNIDGSLDTSFGGDGKVTTAIGSGPDSASSVAVQSDGRILAAGDSSNGANLDYELVRYLPDGRLDTTFGGDGTITTPVGNSTDRAEGIVLLPDGRILVAGQSFNGLNFDFALVRYNGDGRLDTTFDGDGKVTTAIGADLDAVFSVALQADGRIVVAGRSYNGSKFDVALARYNADGSLDTTFDGDGKVTTAIGTGNDGANSIVVQPDGRIVVGGWSENATGFDFALVRYNPDGSLDATFDGDGKVTTGIGPGVDEGQALALQPDGRIVAAGRSHNGTDYDVALVRYLADGRLDATLDGDGTLTVDVNGGDDTVNDVAVQSDGNIIVAGHSAGDFVLIRVLGDRPIVEGGPGDDALAGGSGDDIVRGLDGNDLLSGLGGNDLLEGGAGSDTLVGGEGADTLDGGLGADLMLGGVGNDTYWVDEAGDVVEEVANEAPVLLTLGRLPEGAIPTLSPTALEGFIDTIIAAISYSLASVADVENLLLAAASAAAVGTGNELDNVLSGNELDNTLTGLAGNDTIDGGEGTDTAAYEGSRSAYTAVQSGSGYSLSGPEGIDTLVGVERAQFSDGGLAFDLALNQAAGNTARVIGAAFDAPAIAEHPDWVGIGLDLFDGGMNLSAVCELVTSIMGLDNTAFVTTVYANVVGSAPDAATLAGFVGMLRGGGGSLTQAQLLEAAAAVLLNEVNIDLVGLQAGGVEFL